MITAAGLTDFGNAILERIATAYVVVSGVEKVATIQSKAIAGALITVKVYLDDTIDGTVTSFRLKKNDGTILIDRPDNVVKPAEKGLLAVIELTISEVVS